MAAKKGIRLLSNITRLATSTTCRDVTHNCRRLVPALAQQQLHTSNIRLSDSTVNSGDKFAVINIQDEKDFSEHVLQSKVPVVVDFHATWCNPCKLLTPRLEKILASNPKAVNLVKVDVDKCEDLAFTYKVGEIPTVLAFKNGQIMDKFKGLVDEDVIEEFVEKLVN